MGMGASRVIERVAAAMGKLSEAPSYFLPSLDVPYGGLLCGLPALLENGLLRHSHKLFSLPKGYYNLIHIILLLAFMALGRIKTIERLRFNSPGELGNLLGLDRIPEVRTLREKIKIIAKPESVSQWGEALCLQWMEEEPEAAGVLYIDGHVRNYYGRKTKLPRRYVARQRLCLRGMTDYWINDGVGRPFFVVSTPLTTGLLAMLRHEIAPRLINDVPNQPSAGELTANPFLHRFIMIFDREGYSPIFFKEMWQFRIACQTYNKYPKEDWPQSEFIKQTVVMPYGELVEMKLAERGLRLSNDMWVREIRKLTPTGHQTSVLSTDYIQLMDRIAAHMFSRWSQENFFKYMSQHFNINRLSSYFLHPVTETGKVVNPVYRQLESQIKSKAAILSRRLAEFGKITLKQGATFRQLSNYERKKGDLKDEIDQLEVTVARLKEERKNTNKHIILADLPKEQQFSQLEPTRKQFIDTIRMIAYRAETAMAALLRDVLTDVDDARSLIREIFTNEADLIPNYEENTLTVKLHHLSSRKSDEAARFLLQHLNDAETIYPGTNLRLIYKMVSD
jgi:hypothetical protein